MNFLQGNMQQQQMMMAMMSGFQQTPNFPQQLQGQPQYPNAGGFGQIEVNSVPAAHPPPPVQPPPPPGPPPPSEPNDDEKVKISMLQNQAKMWQESKLLSEQQEAHRKQLEAQQKKTEEEFLNQCKQNDPELAQCLEDEQQFAEQYQTWKSQFYDWKEQNKDHPDKEQYKQYEEQWKTYEYQMDSQKAELSKRREALLVKHKAKLGNTQPRGVPPPVASYDQAPSAQPWNPSQWNAPTSGPQQWQGQGPNQLGEKPQQQWRDEQRTSQQGDTSVISGEAHQSWQNRQQVPNTSQPGVPSQSSSQWNTSQRGVPPASAAKQGGQPQSSLGSASSTPNWDSPGLRSGAWNAQQSSSGPSATGPGRSDQQWNSQQSGDQGPSSGPGQPAQQWNPQQQSNREFASRPEQFDQQWNTQQKGSQGPRHGLEQPDQQSTSQQQGPRGPKPGHVQSDQQWNSQQQGPRGPQPGPRLQEQQWNSQPQGPRGPQPGPGQSDQPWNSQQQGPRGPKPGPGQSDQQWSAQQYGPRASQPGSRQPDQPWNSRRQGHHAAKPDPGQPDSQWKHSPSGPQPGSGQGDQQWNSQQAPRGPTPGHGQLDQQPSSQQQHGPRGPLLSSPGRRPDQQWNSQQQRPAGPPSGSGQHDRPWNARQEGPRGPPLSGSTRPDQPLHSQPQGHQSHPSQQGFSSRSSREGQGFQSDDERYYGDDREPWQEPSDQGSHIHRRNQMDEPGHRPPFPHGQPSQNQQPHPRLAHPRQQGPGEEQNRHIRPQHAQPFQARPQQGQPFQTRPQHGQSFQARPQRQPEPNNLRPRHPVNPQDQNSQQRPSHPQQRPNQPGRNVSSLMSLDVRAPGGNIRGIRPDGPRHAGPRPGAPQNKGTSNPNYEEENGETNWPRFNPSGGMNPGGIRQSFSDARPQRPLGRGPPHQAPNRQPAPRAAMGSAFPRFPGKDTGQPRDSEAKGGNAYNEQKKLIEQLMGADQQDGPSAVVKMDPSKIPQHKLKKPEFEGMTANVMRKSTLSMVLSSTNKPNDDEESKGTEISAENAKEAEAKPNEATSGNKTAVQKTDGEEESLGKAGQDSLSESGGSETVKSSVSESTTSTSSSTASSTNTNAGPRPGAPQQTSAVRQRLPHPGQRPVYPGQRLEHPGQRPQAPGQRPDLRHPRPREPMPGMHPMRPLGPYPQGRSSMRPGIPQPHQRMPMRPGGPRHRMPAAAIEAAKALTSHEHDLLKKATEEIKGNSQAFAGEEDEYNEYPESGPYGEPYPEDVPPPLWRRNLLTMADGYEPQHPFDRPPRPRYVEDYEPYEMERFHRDPYKRHPYDRDPFSRPPRRFEDAYESYEPFHPEARYRREPMVDPYYDEEPYPRMRGRGLLMDEPFVPHGREDPYEDPYQRRRPPFNAPYEMDPMRREPMPREPMPREPIPREFLPREPMPREHMPRDPFSADPHLREHETRDALARGPPAKVPRRELLADPYAKRPGLLAEPSGMATPEVIDYSHRQPATQMSGRLDERTRLPAAINRQEAPSSGFKERSPVRLNQSPVPSTARPPVADLFDAYSSLPVVTDIRDLICKPKRDTRPPHICLIVRGPPGAGKTYCSKLIRDKESANGGSAPRILNLDDYFMVEVERLVTDEDTGRKMKRKMLEYEYEPEMEDSYRADFLKSFKKTVDKGYFSFIIIDAVNDKIQHFEEFAKFARSKSFQVYIVDVQADAQTCFSRNIHNRSLKNIETIIAGWEETPAHFNKVDLRGLLQDNAIDDIEMEDKKSEGSDSGSSSDDDADLIQVAKRSKWDMDADDQKLDKLDGLLHKKSDTIKNMEDFLTPPDDYEAKASGEDGKKHVRWADLEEKRLQDRDREIGFVVGQTNWNRMLDDNYAEKQLNKTKYI